jgi:hypothetical protein
MCDVLEASLWFANSIGADVVVCHAGQRLGSRDARYSLREQLVHEDHTWHEDRENIVHGEAILQVENLHSDCVAARLLHKVPGAKIGGLCLLGLCRDFQSGR